MRRAVWTALLTLFVAFAGCNDEPEGQYFNADFITPGHWIVSANTEYIMAWAQNGFGESRSIDWDLTLRDGSALPEGWTFSMAPPASLLDGAGTSRLGGENVRIYTDHAFSVFRLQLAADVPGGVHEATLHAGDFTKDVSVHLAPPEVRANQTVSEIGDEVIIQYTGRFYDSKEVFATNKGSGTPDLYKIGSGLRILGFEMGLIGLQDGEEAVIAIPAGLAYGHHQPEGSDRAQFNGRNLEFTLQIVNTDPEEGQQDGVEGDGQP